MPVLIDKPTRIPVPGGKFVDEYIGRVNTTDTVASIAHMRSPAGWAEPGQTPEFDEFTVVLKGMLRVSYRGGVLDVRAGQAVVAHRGEWAQDSTPEPERGEYPAVCLAAVSTEPVHR